MYQKNRVLLPLVEGSGAIFDLIQDLLQVVRLNLALHRSATKLFVAADEILSLPMRPECVRAISAPLATLSWAVNMEREVDQLVSVPLLPAREDILTYETLPELTRKGNGWCDGALDRGGRRRNAVLWLSGNMILVVVRLGNSLPRST